MIPILINLFYVAVLALVVAAGAYLYRTREQAAAEVREAETATGDSAAHEEPS